MITNSELGQYAGHFLRFLKSGKINSISDLEKRVGLGFDFLDGRIKISSQKGPKKAFIYTVEYSIVNVGVPILLEVVTEPRRFTIYVQSSEDIKNYSKLGTDVDGNKKQFKKVGQTFLSVRNELRDLVV